MVPILITILVILVIIVWGLSSISASLAAAKQAQATIEAAHAAQVASTGNLVSLITTAAVVIVILAGIAVTFWIVYQARIRPLLASLPGNRKSFHAVNGSQQPQVSTSDPLGQLVTLATLQMLRDMQRDPRTLPPSQQPALEEPDPAEIDLWRQK
jgi:flagellar basal body-associated protein FliL